MFGRTDPTFCDMKAYLHVSQSMEKGATFKNDVFLKLQRNTFYHTKNSIICNEQGNAEARGCPWCEQRLTVFQGSCIDANGRRNTDADNPSGSTMTYCHPWRTPDHPNCALSLPRPTSFPCSGSLGCWGWWWIYYWTLAAGWECKRGNV